MEELQTVCEDLDETTDDIMSLLNEILVSQSELDSSIRNGFFLMSKARYSVGVKRISSVQYNINDLEAASLKVKVTDDKHNSDSLSYILLNNDKNSDDKNNDDKNNDAEEDKITSSVLRQRYKDKDRNISDLTNGVEDIDVTDEKLSEQSEKDQDQAEDKKSSVHKKHNPLNWFGVLVPQALRQSQTSFKRAVDQCCHLASLKDKLIKLRTKHKGLMDRKLELRPHTAADSDSVSESEQL